MTDKTEAAQALLFEVQAHIDLGYQELVTFYQSVEECLNELIARTDEPEDIMAFTVYKSCEEMDAAPAFLEAWGQEIGYASGVIIDLSTSLKNSLREEGV